MLSSVGVQLYKANIYKKYAIKFQVSIIQIMIFCYIPNQIDDKKLSLIKSLLNERYLMFFCEVDAGIEIINEKNQKVLREIVLHFKPILFWVHSIKELQMSATILSELIIFLLKHNCIFQSEQDNFYWKDKDIHTVYPKIFELLK